MKKILLPIDSEKPCQKTLYIATDWAKTYDAEIVVLHVNHVYETLSHPYADIKLDRTPEAYEAYMKSSMELLEKTAKTLREAGVKVDVKLLSGDAATEICDYAEENNFDLIIISSHGHSAIRRFLLGGVTTKVVHHSTVPVMVVR